MYLSASLWRKVNRADGLLGELSSVVPQMVWQVGRPPYQSEILYGGVVPVWDANISVWCFSFYVIAELNSTLPCGLVPAHHTGSGP